MDLFNYDLDFNVHRTLQNHPHSSSEFVRTMMHVSPDMLKEGRKHSKGMNEVVSEAKKCEYTIWQIEESISRLEKQLKICASGSGFPKRYESRSV